MSSDSTANDSFIPESCVLDLLACGTNVNIGFARNYKQTSDHTPAHISCYMITPMISCRISVMTFSHAHVVTLCEREGIARRVPGAADSKTTIRGRWRTLKKVYLGTGRLDKARIGIGYIMLLDL
jgi:hypothetical protein